MPDTYMQVKKKNNLITIYFKFLHLAIILPFLSIK